MIEFLKTLAKGNMIEYRKGSVFDAPDGTILLHACNCKGVWGSGVAAQMKALFPEAYYEYYDNCAVFMDNLVGSYQVIPTPVHFIVNLFTSKDYGTKVDKPEEILVHTDLALKLFFESLVKFENPEIHSPKINAGFFKVPWVETEKIINKYLKEYPNVKWIVWEL